MEEKPKSEPGSYWTEYRPLCLITYQCMVCMSIKNKFQPLPRELNSDHRQFCHTCKKIVNHLQRVSPPA